jgi:hypothetical protein
MCAPADVDGVALGALVEVAREYEEIAPGPYVADTRRSV